MILIVYYLFLCSVFVVRVACWQILDLWNVCVCVSMRECMLQTAAVHTMTNITTKQ